MNIDKLPKAIKDENNNVLFPQIHVTIWNNWCITYKNRDNKEFSVVIEPDKEPVEIDDTIGTINERIGNARNFETAVFMILKYINKHYSKLDIIY